MQVSALPQGVLPQHRSCVTIREPWVAWVAGNCARLEPSPAYWRGFFNFSSGGENLRATAGPGSAGHRETWVSSGPSAVEGGCGADLPAPDPVSLGCAWGVPRGCPSSSCSLFSWGCFSSLCVSVPQPGSPARAGHHRCSRGRPPALLCCAIAEASPKDPADVAGPGCALGAAGGRGSEGAGAWLPAPVTSFHFHTT